MQKKYINKYNATKKKEKKKKKQELRLMFARVRDAPHSIVMMIIHHCPTLNWGR